MWLKKEGLFRLIWVLIHPSPTRSYAITTVVACLCVGYHLLLFRIHWASSLQSREEGYIIHQRKKAFTWYSKNQPCYSVSVQLLISRLFVTLWFAHLPSLVFFSPFLLTLSGRKDSLFEYIRSVTNLEESEMETDALSDLNLPCLIMQSTFFRSYLVSQRHTPAMLSGILMGFLPLVHVKK